MKSRKKIFIMIFTLFIVLCLAGCKKETYTNSFNVYYTNSDINKLVSVSYGTNQTDTYSTIGELLNQMNTVQKSNDVVVIKKEYVSIDKYEIIDNIANIYFNQEYYNMNSTRQALFRGAVVKTLTQIAGIDYVMFYVDNIPVTYLDGATIGMMSASDFIDADGNSVSDLQWSDLSLYFANAKGDKLVKENFSVAYSRNVSIERAIVEQLIKGPDTTSDGMTLPANLKLLNISVKDGICYVNLNSEFLTEIVNVSSSIPIYSIVDSLCELSNIDKVQFLINGDSKKVYRETISLEAPFEMNTDIIYQNNQ
ncbi:germination protein M [[Clostridium] fimetarium]|uniref:Germination protein M n=2 Tax=[Clostridium] fimetarium TaxID=99656 RepID=A0A1I0QYU8_9FIRM|nr:germination protein M [[Clostridium] fimetarium]